MEPKPNSTASGNPKNELSEEDLALKRQIERYVETLQDADSTLRTVAICSMWLEIRISTSSVISVSKPLKFLHPCYETLKSHYKLMPETDLKKLLADILSVLAWTTKSSDQADRECLKYRFLGSKGYIGYWGDQYVWYLANVLIQEFLKGEFVGANMDDQKELSLQLLKYSMEAEIPLKHFLSMTDLFYLELKHENKATFRKNMSVPKKFSKINYLQPPYNRRRHDKSYSLLK